MSRKSKINGKKRKSGFGIAVFFLTLAVTGSFLYGKFPDFSLSTKTVGSFSFDSAEEIQSADTVASQSTVDEVTVAEVPEIEVQTTESTATQFPTAENVAQKTADYPAFTDRSAELGEEYDARYALLFDVSNNEVIAYRNESTKMYPASLTKVMTLIVAVENTENFSDTILITNDMVLPMQELDASRAGFEPGDTPTVKDALYGMILPSGADASLAVAEYVAGSEKAFVELMNKKAVEMGLEDTHFTNVTGLHDKKHYSSARDMAMILEYAVKNTMCREILSAVEYEYEPEPTELYPDGLVFTSTLFSRMYGDEMPFVTIKGGKTGFTDEAGNCIESFAEIFGKTYILVMCGGTTNWNAVYNTLSAYSVYCAGGEPYKPEQNTHN